MTDNKNGIYAIIIILNINGVLALAQNNDLAKS